MKQRISKRQWALNLGAVIAGSSLVAASYAAPAKKGDDELAALEATIPGELVNDPRALIDLSQNGGGAKTKVVKSGDIPGGGAALQVRVDTPNVAEPWRISGGMGLTKSIARGEVVTIGFYARALPDKDGNATGKLGIRIQQNVSPWSGFLDSNIDIGPNWQWYEKAGVATVPTVAGASSVSIFVGSKAQVVEIGQVIIVKGANAIASTVVSKPVITLPPALEKVAGKLVNHPEAGPWNFYGTGGTKAAIDDKNIFMGKASRVTVTTADGKPWELAMSVPVDGPVKQGDRYLIAIAAKTVSSASPEGKARVGLRFQSMKPPYDGFADNAIMPGMNWQLLQLRTTASIDIPEGDAAFSLMFGGQIQVVDIGPVYVMKLD